MFPPPRRSPLFPYTTLFRSRGGPASGGPRTRPSGARVHSGGLTGGRSTRRSEHEQRTGVFAVDRKSTRLNSSHPSIPYAVSCLKKKKQRYHTGFLYILFELM